MVMAWLADNYVIQTSILTVLLICFSDRVVARAIDHGSAERTGREICSASYTEGVSPVLECHAMFWM